MCFLPLHPLKVKRFHAHSLTHSLSLEPTPRRAPAALLSAAHSLHFFDPGSAQASPGACPCILRPFLKGAPSFCMVDVLSVDLRSLTRRLMRQPWEELQGHQLMLYQSLAFWRPGDSLGWRQLHRKVISWFLDHSWEAYTGQTLCRLASEECLKRLVRGRGRAHGPWLKFLV